MVEEPKIKLEEGMLLETEEQETGTETEQETEKPEITSFSVKEPVNSPVLLKCPSCGATHNKSGKDFLKFSQVRGHWQGMKDEKHEGAFPYTKEDLGLLEDNKTEESRASPPRRVKAELHQEPVEPLPDELEHLETLLKEHGIKRRAVVLRSMSLRDPASIQELVWALDDVGVAKSRQRRIVTDYSKWLGVRVPEAVIDALSPKEEYESPDRFGRRPYVPEETYEDPRKAVLADMELSELIEIKKNKIKAEIREIENPRSRYGGDQRVENLTAEVKRLASALADEKEKRNEDRFTRLEDLIKKSAENRSSDLQTVTTAVKDMAKSYFAFLSGITDEPPKRERLFQGKSDVTSLVPEEMLE